MAIEDGWYIVRNTEDTHGAQVLVMFGRVAYAHEIPSTANPLPPPPRSKVLLFIGEPPLPQEGWLWKRMPYPG